MLFASVALTSAQESIQNQSFKETVFPFLFKFRTISISLAYVAFIFRNSAYFSYIHYQHPDPASALALIVTILYRRIKTPLIITWHADVYKQYFFLAPILLVLDLILFHLATEIIFLSPAHRKTSLFSKIGLLKHKDIVLPATVSISCSQRTRPVYPNSEKINVISIGRLVEYKGYKYAIRAFQALDPSFCYHIVGEGPLLVQLNKLAQRLGCADRIIFHGKINDQTKYDLLKMSNIFLFPSITQSEAYGLSQIEAMYFGLPIVNTQLENGVNALAPQDVAVTVRKKSSRAIVDALNLVVSSPTLYDKLVHNSYSRYLQVNGDTIQKHRNIFIEKLLGLPL